jgi:hypothetical protein
VVGDNGPRLALDGYTDLTIHRRPTTPMCKLPENFAAGKC